MEHANHSQGLSEVILSIGSVVVGLVVIFHLIPTQIVDPDPSIPNSKTFPYVIAVLFTLLCCRWVYSSIKEFINNRQFSIPVNLFAGLAIGGLFIVVSSFIESIGYIIGGVLATVIVIVAIEGLQRWMMALVAGIVTTLGFAFFFGRLLHIEIPTGIFSLFG